MVAVELRVNAFAQPGDAHQQEELEVQEELVGEWVEFTNILLQNLKDSCNFYRPIILRFCKKIEPSYYFMKMVLHIY